jgi:hypothetical protein
MYLRKAVDKRWVQSESGCQAKARRVLPAVFHVACKAGRNSAFYSLYSRAFRRKGKGSEKGPVLRITGKLKAKTA